MNKNAFYSIAPMMGRTDSYFCYILNLINNEIPIYTEMMHTNAVINSKKISEYVYLPNKSKIIFQLGGNNPEYFKKAAEIIAKLGFKEININCGCPSSRVQAGSFGISLLSNPKLVRDCADSIKQSTNLAVSIKTRIGVNYVSDNNILDNFVNEVSKSGVKKFIIHARNAILKDFSAKNNLNIPSLNYDRVYKLKKDFKDKEIIINGGFKSFTDNSSVLNKVDGIMIGREAYKNPWMFLKRGHSSDLEHFEVRKKIMLKYLLFLSKCFFKTNFNTVPLIHAQSFFYMLKGSKEWKRILSNSLKTKKLECLFNFIRYNKEGYNNEIKI